MSSGDRRKTRYSTLLELAQLWLAQLIEAHDMLAQLIELHEADAHDMLAQDIAFHVGSLEAAVIHESESNCRSPVAGSVVTNRFRPRFGLAAPSAVVAAAPACTSPTPSAPPAV